MVEQSEHSIIRVYEIFLHTIFTWACAQIKWLPLSPIHLLRSRKSLDMIQIGTIGINFEVPRFSKITMRDLFKTQTVRLAKEEERNNRNDRIKQTPEEEGPPTHIGNHVWRCKREHEIE
jgi:hypothetical protein